MRTSPTTASPDTGLWGIFGPAAVAVALIGAILFGYWELSRRVPGGPMSDDGLAPLSETVQKRLMSRDFRVRDHARAWLLQQGPRERRKILEPMLADDGQRKRLAAVRELGRAGGLPERARLAEVAEHDSSALVRASAAAHLHFLVRDEILGIEGEAL